MVSAITVAARLLSIYVVGVHPGEDFGYCRHWIFDLVHSGAAQIPGRDDRRGYVMKRGFGSLGIRSEKVLSSSLELG